MGYLPAFVILMSSTWNNQAINFLTELCLGDVAFIQCISKQRTNKCTRIQLSMHYILIVQCKLPHTHTHTHTHTDIHVCSSVYMYLNLIGEGGGEGKKKKKKCIVCAPGHDPLIFTLLSFSVLIG